MSERSAAVSPLPLLSSPLLDACRPAIRPSLSKLAANAVRLLASVGVALTAFYWLDLGVIGSGIAVALAVCVHAARKAWATSELRDPLEGAVTRRAGCQEPTGDSSHVPISPIYFAGC